MDKMDKFELSEYLEHKARIYGKMNKFNEIQDIYEKIKEILNSPEPSSYWGVSDKKEKEFLCCIALDYEYNRLQEEEKWEVKRILSSYRDRYRAILGKDDRISNIIKKIIGNG
jgi:hypothetical protein